ncbi:MAG: TetR/AcrR family transcriptional regulator [Chloroflexi bacterium]|nr:TetR/AcrR family transcriptional regulator [Chloroflexota bacterium]
MDTEQPLRPGRSGRPRSRAADQAILRATVELIADSGIHAVSLDAVAARAHAGKDTIYRRWAHKDELMEAALRHALRPSPRISLSTDARADLRAHLQALARALSRPPLRTVLREAIAEAPRDPMVAASLDRFRMGHEAAMARLVGRCLDDARADDDPRPDDQDARTLAALFLGALVGDRLMPGVATDPDGEILLPWVVAALLDGARHQA